MIIIVCLDNKKGMMFNHRRQSRDQAVTEKIRKICMGKKLWMSPYSAQLYGSLEGVEWEASSDFLSLASSGEYCLVESAGLAAYKESIEQVIVFRWDRTYPADVYLDLDLSKWKRKARHVFSGASHNKITEERYKRKETTADFLVTDCRKVENSNETISKQQFPPYSGQPYIEIYGNQPRFSVEDKTKEPFELYSELDPLGRCGVAYVTVGKAQTKKWISSEKQKRGNLGNIKLSGWHTVEYDIVDGKYLYNRCHLIANQLISGKVNKKKLITGTHSMNMDGMLPFENMVADYVKETENHVLYRVTPIFEGINLLAKGVQIEAYSVEDEGDGICFHVFVYNVQSGIRIDYATGASKEDSGKDVKETPAPNAGNKVEQDGVGTKTQTVEIRGNKKSKIFHCLGQDSYEKMADSDNLVIFHSEQETQDAGYRKAKR